VDGRQGAVQAQALAHFAQGKVGLFGHERAQLASGPGGHPGPASGPVMAGGKVARVPTLLEELFDHAQGHGKAISDLLPAHITTIISLYDAQAQVHREGLWHPQNLPETPHDGYINI
jgi:hypothetical protein